MDWDEASAQLETADFARYQRDAQRRVDEPTREQIEQKWRVLGEGWKFAQRDAVLTPMLEAAKREGNAGIYHGLVPVLETYRRELEAL